MIQFTMMLLTFIAAGNIPPVYGDSNPIPPREKYLLLDSRIIEKVDGVILKVGTVAKHSKNPLFKEDKPWEVRIDNVYANVIWEPSENVYKCWYNPFIMDKAVANTPPDKRKTVTYIEAYKQQEEPKREMGVCYAVSYRDGIRWEKHNMYLAEYNGNKYNNIILRGPQGVGIFKDDIDPDPQRRYKMFFKDPTTNTLSVSFSRNEVSWQKPISCPKIGVEGDTHNNAFWSPEIGKYVGITRMWSGENKYEGVRQVGRTESSDFIHWTQAKVILEGLEPHLQTYAMPVFRYADIYLGLVMIFDTKADRVHCELTWSPDTYTWYRIDPGTPLIPNSEKEGDYDWGCVYAGAYPIFLENEIRLYYGGSNGPHTNWRESGLCLATLRPDGFAGYEVEKENETAVITTKPLICSGKNLAITADVECGGSVIAIVIDDKGASRITGVPITNTVTDGAVQWEGGGDLSEFMNKSIRLKIEIKDAKVYSVGFVK